jgi:DNA ligase (NAD+)
LKNISIKENKLTSNKLSGKKFCFTGSFSNPTRSEMEKMVGDNGGKNSSVSKNLTALVWDGEIQGGKMEKAKGLNIPIITQNDFLAMLR